MRFELSSNEPMTAWQESTGCAGKGKTELDWPKRWERNQQAGKCWGAYEEGGRGVEGIYIRGNSGKSAVNAEEVGDTQEASYEKLPGQP